MSKPNTTQGYQPEWTQRVHSTCLHLISYLGDLMDDTVVIGGLVPSLIVRQDSSAAFSRHVGTLDLDLGLTLAVLNEKRYQSLTDRLKTAGFAPDTTADGKITRQRWVRPSENVTVDFLIPPTKANEKGGTLRNIKQDFAAIIAPGLHLAFKNRVSIEMQGHTQAGERIQRRVWVCGAGAFIVLKALAFNNRGENKDAYDLYYLLRFYGQGLADLIQQFSPLQAEPEAVEALAILKRDFTNLSALGACRAAEFLFGRRDEDTQADVAGLVREFLRGLA